MSTRSKVRKKSSLKRPQRKKRKVKNTRAKGNKGETRVKEWLEEDGWDCIKSKASRGPFDLWAAHPDYDFVRLIQSKTNDMPPPKYRDMLAAYSFGPKNRKEIWIWIDRTKEPRVIIYVEERDSWIEVT